MIFPAMKNRQDDTPIILLGWSLGGKIALEIAALFEAKGYKKILVYILDSFWNLSGHGLKHEELVEHSIQQFLASRGGGADSSLIEQHRQVADREYTLAEQPLSRNLKFSKVTLFKAGKCVEPGNEFLMRAVDSFDNGLSNGVRKLKVILFDDCDHNDIIEKEDDIVDVIVDDVSAISRVH
jgi:hypothetical protein